MEKLTETMCLALGDNAEKFWDMYDRWDGNDREKIEKIAGDENIEKIDFVFNKLKQDFKNLFRKIQEDLKELGENGFEVSVKRSCGYNNVIDKESIQLDIKNENKDLKLSFNIVLHHANEEYFFDYSGARFTLRFWLYPYDEDTKNKILEIFDNNKKNLKFYKRSDNYRNGEKWGEGKYDFAKLELPIEDLENQTVESLSKMVSDKIDFIIDILQDF